MDLEQRTVRSADGVTLAYDVCGAGTTALVFVHGWSGHRGHWDRQLDDFAARHTVVRIDLAGHGGSAIDRRRWTVGAFATDVVAVCNALTLPSMILVGHSLGGSVIALAAQLMPERVLGLIGIDTWSALGVRHTAEEIEASVMLPDMRRDFRTAARPLAISILEEAIQEGPHGIEQGLRALDVPRSAISSATFRPKDPSVLAAFGIHNVVVPGTGHYLMLEQPAMFNRALAAAVARSAS